MLNQDDVRDVLTLQSQAYALLMWLGEAALKDPMLLSPAVVEVLSDAEGAGTWVRARRAQFPGELVPDVVEGPFANLLASFFTTSFQVKHLEFDGTLRASRLTAVPPGGSQSHLGFAKAQALALKHLASSEGIPLTEKAAGTISRRSALRQPTLLWTYVWELDRRARGKGKGPVVYQIWRSLSMETRRALGVEEVWAARELLLAASRERQGLDE